MPRLKRVRLTANRIDTLRCPPGQKQAFLWDSDVPGLAVRVTSTGTKAFIVQGELHGKTLRRTLKETELTELDKELTELEKARKKGREWTEKVSKGIDPDVDEARKKQAKAEEAVRQKVAEALVRDAWNDYLAEREERWSARHLLDHRKLSQDGSQERRKGGGLRKPGPLAPLMEIRLADLTAARVETWIKSEAIDRPTQSRLALRLLRAFLAWCGEHPQYGQIVGTGIITNRAKETLPKQQARRDCLQKEQLAGWFKQVREIQNPVISAYLQCLLLTGARREEVAGLRWQDIDFKWCKIVIHDKVEGERVIPLTPYVADLLRRLPRRNEWVFSSPTAASGRLQSAFKPHNRALAEAGIEDNITMHGLRRSFGSLSEWVELPVGVVAQIMGHKPSATAERHYRVRPLDLLRQWAERYEAWILEQAGIEVPEQQEPGEVLRLVASR